MVAAPQEPGLGASIDWEQIAGAELKRDACVA
jgi:hypothetical protein